MAGIDRPVGKRGRSAFLAEVAREEIQRRRTVIVDAMNGKRQRHLLADFPMPELALYSLP